jgi:hypothetical protein
MEKRTVNFFSEGSRIEGDLFLPDGLKSAEQRPGVVLCQGFTGVRSLILPDYAKVFVDAGFVVLTFDYRGWARSEGPKWRLVPLEQVDDIRNALTFLQAQPQVDPDRLGLWGTSYGGGHAPYVAGVDARVKAVVGQVGYDAAERLFFSCLTYSERMDLMRKLRRHGCNRARQRPKTADGAYSRAPARGLGRLKCCATPRPEPSPSKRSRMHHPAGWRTCRGIRLKRHSTTGRSTWSTESPLVRYSWLGRAMMRLARSKGLKNYMSARASRRNW